MNSHFTAAEREAFKSALKDRDGSDVVHGAAIDVAIGVYRRHFLTGVTGDLAYGASRIGWIMAHMGMQNPDDTIAALDKFFVQQGKDAIPAG